MAFRPPMTGSCRRGFPAVNKARVPAHGAGRAWHLLRLGIGGDGVRPEPFVKKAPKAGAVAAERPMV